MPSLNGNANARDGGIQHCETSTASAGDGGHGKLGEHVLNLSLKGGCRHDGKDSSSSSRSEILQNGHVRTNDSINSNKKKSQWSSMLSSVLHSSSHQAPASAPISTSTRSGAAAASDLLSQSRGEQGEGGGKRRSDDDDADDDEEEGEEEEGLEDDHEHAGSNCSSSSDEHLSLEDCEALLWDAQTALIGHQYQTAVAHLRLAARAGSSAACISLAKIYLRGLPCVHSKPKTSSLSPSKLIEGSIPIDPIQGATYLIKALQLEANTSEHVDVELIGDASSLLCNLYRYGRIRPATDSHPEIMPSSSPIASGLTCRHLKSVSPSSTPKGAHIQLDRQVSKDGSSLCADGEMVARRLSLRLEECLCYHGILDKVYSTDTTSLINDPPYSDHSNVSNIVANPSSATNIDKVHAILVHLHYIVAICASFTETEEAVQRSIFAWRALLDMHAAIQKHSAGSATSSRPRPKRSMSLGSMDVEDLVIKAGKRLDLLLQAQTQSDATTSKAQKRLDQLPALRRSSTNGETTAPLLSPPLLEPWSPPPVSVSSPPNLTPSLQDITSEGSMRSLCNCGMPAPLSTSASKCSPASPKKKRAVFALHDSPNSTRSASAPKINKPVPIAGEADSKPSSASRKASSNTLFKGFVRPHQKLDRKPSLLIRHDSSTTLNSLHSTVAQSALALDQSTGPSYDYWHPARRQVVRVPSQISLAATQTTHGPGRRGWSSAASKPLSGVSNLSSASLHNLAPSVDLRSRSTSVMSLPHLPNHHSRHSSSSAHLALSKLHPVHTQRRSPLAPAAPQNQPGPHSGITHYTERVKNSFASLHKSWFSAASSQASANGTTGRIEANLRDMARKHDEEVSSVCWYADDCSSEAETVESDLHDGEGTTSGRLAETDLLYAVDGQNSSLPSTVTVAERKIHNVPLRQSINRHTSILSTSIPSSMLLPQAPEHRPPSEPRVPPTTPNTRHGAAAPSSPPPKAKGPVKIDPLLAALEAASRVNVKSRCAVCGIQGVNFPKCHKCDMTFCSRDVLGLVASISLQCNV